MKALLVVDMQNDFMPGGALAVPHAEEIIPLINSLMSHFPLVIATQDWHPLDHVCFAKNHPGKKIGETVAVKDKPQRLWPVHCLAFSQGAELAAALDQKKIAKVFHKGTQKDVDSYSAFFDNAHKRSTGLDLFLKEKGVKELYIAGVATEYCVLFSALDACELGFSVFVITGACRAIDPHEGEKALQLIASRGGKLA